MRGQLAPQRRSAHAGSWRTCNRSGLSLRRGGVSKPHSHQGENEKTSVSSDDSVSEERQYGALRPRPCASTAGLRRA